MNIFYLFFVLIISSPVFSDNAQNHYPDSIIGYETYGTTDNFLFFDNKDYEVLYFFSYSCSSCYEFSNVFSNWVKTIDSNKIGVKPIPVVFREHWVFTSKIYFISNSLGLKDIDNKIFSYIHNNKKYIISDNDILLFFKTIYDIDKDKIEPYLNNPILINAIEQGTLIADKFDIPATPYFVVIDKNKNVFRLSHRISKSDLGLISSLNYLINPNFKALFDLQEENNNVR